MMLGLDFALSEITLVLFTTLAPSGTVALIIMSVLLIANRSDDAAVARVNQMLCMPLVVTMVGLVASATHLGNPANALYVFTGVGRSPLSNEVFFAVIFLGLSGAYWLYSFTRKRRQTIERIWLVAIIAAGLLFLDRLSAAYSVDTIITWDSPLIPAALWLNSLVGGPVLALLSLDIADCRYTSLRLRRALCATSAVAWVANLAVLALYGREIEGMGNSIAQADNLVTYPLFIALFAILSACGIVLMCTSTGAMKDDESRDKSLALGRIRRRQAIACILVFLGIFAIRFAFYALHMTVGLSL